MANTYTQIYIHVIFAVEARQNILPESHKEEIHKYMAGIVRNQGQKLIAINTMPDHAHLLMGLKPNMPLSDLVRDVKSDSSVFINGKGWIRGKFRWQEGFGGFSCGQSQLSAVVEYIRNQESHHRKKTFKDEYLAFLRRYKIEYDEKYVFHEN